MKHRLSCKDDDVDSIEEVIDIQRDLERYPKDTLRKIKPQQGYHMEKMSFGFETKGYEDFRKINDDKNKGVSECMEKANLEDEINHWEKKLKHIEWEYSHSMTKDWPKIRERELFIIREIARLKKLKNDKKFATSSSTMEDKIIASAETKANAIINKNAIINNNNKDKNIVQEEEVISEEEQWDINNKLLLESYEEEEELIKEIWLEDERYDDSEQNSDFYNSLDDVGLHNLDNAMEVWK
uniref:Uncharacterized protein n=1 Tax=Aegilops tauschii subsp. strangulata TaxID=200361 RepID=A0A452XR52_AEGTS